MSDRSDPRPDDATLPEDAAHRLLARAVELDVRRASDVPVAQLREVAREAGISPRAFEDALLEVCAEQEKAPARAPAAAPPTSWRTVWDAVVTNVLAFAAFWVVLSVVSRIERSLAVSWPIDHGSDVAVGLVGVALALRLRGRAAATIIAVVTIAQLVLYPIHLMFGIDTVNNGLVKWALLFATLLGIVFGMLLTRRRGTPPDPSAAPNVPTATPSPSAAPVAMQPPPSSLRLRAV